jgi:predicted O-linked N-acetylglucosamine transferase (SPINDLY family)
MQDYQIFNSLESNISNNPFLKEQNKKILYETGFRIISNSYDINIKDEILTKLITLYPDDSNLYLKMANMFKSINFQKAILWHKIAYQIDSTNIDNICDLFQIYLDTGLSKNVFEIKKNEKINQFMENERFLGLFARCHFQNLYYKNGVEYLLKLIKKNSKKNCITKEDKHKKWSNYHDIGFVYCVLGNIENALLYTNKATDLALKFDLHLKDKMLSFSNSLCYEDFGYPDNEELFKKYQKIHIYYADNPSFSFKNKTLKPNVKIRIGYVSSDFINHAVANFIFPILKNHDTAIFEIFLFVNNEEIIDKFKSLNHKYIFIDKLNDMEAAKMINNHNIDILIDLNGHTVNNRLGIFALHPAPIQITYLGYPNTTGMKSIQYRITDSIADNPETTQRYSEKLIRLPKCFLLFNSFNQLFPTTPRKTSKEILLGAINKENKNSKYVLETWSTILKECPNAKILIKLETFDNNEERMEFYTKQLNVPENRIKLINKLSNEEYDLLFTKFDILLDTFPYSGTTTTCNSLYNSIPIVSLYNKNQHSHNVSCSILTNCGLPELVAKTKDEYICIVKNLVNNPEKIDEYKNTIHEKFMKLMEPRPFMNSYEKILVDCYEKKFKKDNYSDKSDKISMEILD